MKRKFIACLVVRAAPFALQRNPSADIGTPWTSLSGESKGLPALKIGNVQFCASFPAQPAPQENTEECSISLALEHIREAGGELDQIQFLLGHVSVQTTESYLGCKQRLRNAVNDRIGIGPSF